MLELLTQFSADQQITANQLLQGKPPELCDNHENIKARLKQILGVTNLIKQMVIPGQNIH